MRLITVSGPPSSGKTSVVIRAVEQMGGGEKVMVVNCSCISRRGSRRPCRGCLGVGQGLIVGIDAVVSVGGELVGGLAELLLVLGHEGLGLLVLASA